MQVFNNDRLSIGKDDGVYVKTLGNMLGSYGSNSYNSLNLIMLNNIFEELKKEKKVVTLSDKLKLNDMKLEELKEVCVNFNIEDKGLKSKKDYIVAIINS